MIPYFYVASYLPYVKCARLYLPNMEALAQNMTHDEYEMFTEMEYFKIRRANQFWGGNFTDQTIDSS